MTEQRIRPAEFARRMGWHRSTVTRLIRSGRIAIGPDGLIDEAAARQSLAETETAARPDVAARHEQRRLQKTEKSCLQGENTTVKHPPYADTKKNAPEAEQDPLQPDSLRHGRHDTLTAIKTERERLGLERDRMELGRLRAELMPRAEVEAALDDLVASVRQGLDSLPHAVAGSLVGLDFAAIHATLRDAIAALMRDMHAQAQRELADLAKPQGQQP